MSYCGMRRLPTFALFALLCSACLLDSNPGAAAPSYDDEDGGVAVSAEQLTLGCQPTADLAAKQFLQWAANASDAETHWFSDGAYWQIGGRAFNQPVRARAYWQRSVSGTRTAQLHFCDDVTCSYYATYACGCSGFYSCAFK